MSFEDARETVEGFQKVIPKGFKPDWNDLEHLYEVIVAERPLLLIEYGSGYSTFVIWQAMNDIEKGHAFSLESDPVFYQIIMAYGQGWLHNPVGLSDDTPARSLIFSPVMSVDSMTLAYSYCPIRYADMIYVDGPPLMGEQRLLANIWDLRPLPSTILVDGRPMQCKEIQARLETFYEVNRDDEHKRTLFRQQNKYRGMFLIDTGQGYYKAEHW